MFQIKDFRSIAASMLNWMRATQTHVTDFNVGGITRTMLEASAIELDELYQQYFIGLREAIPVSVYTSFDFSRLPARPASGLVRVTISVSATAVVIQQGTVFTKASGGTTYQSLQNVTIAAGQTFADVGVAAVTAGTIGNIPVLTVFTANPSPTGFVSATNNAPFINGAAEESDDERKARFQSYIQSLSRGTTSALLYGVKTSYLADSAGNQIEVSKFASVVEPWVANPAQPIGLVNVYIHNGVGGTSNGLVSQSQKVIDGYTDVNNVPVPGWKAAGVRVVVIPATETTINVTGVLSLLSGYDSATVIAQAASAVTSYIQNLDLGETAVRSEIISLIMELPGLYDVSVSLPAANVTSAKSVKLMPGIITLTAP